MKFEESALEFEEWWQREHRGWKQFSPDDKNAIMLFAQWLDRKEKARRNIAEGELAKE